MHSCRFMMISALAVMSCLCGQSCQAQAVTNTWTGTGGDTDWFNADNWDQPQWPQDGHHVVIDSATYTNVLLTSASADLASCLITNCSLTFSNWSTTLNATDVAIQNGGRLTLPGAFTESQMSNRVHVACSNFMIEAGGVIDADGKGYAAQNGIGKGTKYSLYWAGGAGYGGGGGEEHRTRGDMRARTTDRQALRLPRGAEGRMPRTGEAGAGPCASTPTAR